MLSDRIRQCKARPTVSVNDLSPLALARHAVVRLPETHDCDPALVEEKAVLEDAASHQDLAAAMWGLRMQAGWTAWHVVGVDQQVVKDDESLERV